MSRALQLGWVLVVQNCATTTYMIYDDGGKGPPDGLRKGPLLRRVLKLVSVVSKLYGVSLPG